MYKALKNFSGILSMSVGDVCEIADESIAKDLLRVGYIQEIKPAQRGGKPKEEKAEEPKEEPKAEEPKRRKKRG